MSEKEQVLYDLFAFPVNYINYLINISKKNKYIYFETPKVGSSTIKNTLQRLEVDDESTLPNLVHDKHLSPLLSPLNLEKNFNEYLTDEYFKFSFVRNPYARILSCYLDKMFGIEKDNFRPKLNFNAADSISFKDFLLAIKKQSYSEMDTHWIPQHILLGSENITLDFIGRQENFDNDLEKVISKITHADTTSTTIMNEKPHAVEANKKLKEYITKEVSKLIYDIYYDDFILYGYDRDPFSTRPLAPVESEKSSTKIFFLIPTCEKYSHKAEAIRNTWIKQLDKLGFKHLFIIGKPERKQAKIINDTLYVPCKDDYESLLLKLILAYEYLYEHFEFDYVHKIDDDCFLDVEKFKADIYPQIHSKKYFGCKVNPKGSKLDTKWHCGKCAHPNFEEPFSKDKVPFSYALGLGYLLHKEVLPTLFAYKDEFKKELETYVYSYEDLRIGEILYHHHIFPVQLKNYTTVLGTNYIGSTINLVYDIEDPQLMFKIERDLDDQKLLTSMKLIDSSMVSIIVPAFNVENDISRCLDSLINQTYQNIEIIIVNDASTDNTRNVVDRYIQMDRRITCIDKEENAGLLQARMTGIEKAKGAYIYSVDSDDYVMPDLVKDTFEEALKHNADIVQFPMKLDRADSKYSHNWTIKKYQEYTKNNFFLYNGNSWTIMFKKGLGDILRKYIGSLSVNYHEDYIISIILSAFYKKVRYIDTAYYVYCDTDTSMTRQYNDEAILKYIRDTLVFTKFMKGLVPIIFPKENSDYLFTIVSNRIRLMNNQLNLYFKESKNVSIYDLYNNTNKNKTFIINSMLYEAIQIKATELKQQDTQLKQKDTQLNQKDTQLNQKDTQLNQKDTQLNQKDTQLKQQDTQLKQQDTQLKQQDTQLKQENQKLYQKDKQLKRQLSKINKLLDNRWYRFGEMSHKKKIWTVAKVMSKKTKTYWLLKPFANRIKEFMDSKGKKKVFIFANCHGNIYKEVLSNADKDNVLTIEHVLSYENLKNYKSIKHKFSECDILIIQPVQNYEKWKMENILPLLKKDCTVIRIPFLRFNGYWDKNNIRELNKFKQPAVMFFPIIKDETEVLKYLDGDLIDKDQVTVNFESAVDELKSLENQGDIKFVDFIMENHQIIPLFRDAYHPTQTMYDFISHQLVEAVQNRVTSLSKSSFSLPKQWGKEYGHFKPIDNATAKILGLEYDLDSYFKYSRLKYLKSILHYENQINIDTINDLSRLTKVLDNFDETTMQITYTFTHYNNCIAYDKEWQFPAITEQHAFQMLRNNKSIYNDNTIYIAFPWATLIDLLDRQDARSSTLLDVLTQIKKEIPGKKNIITVCQHINMLRYQNIFAEVGVTDIFWTHAIKDQYTLPKLQDTKIHPFPLYPVQVTEKYSSIKERDYLYSFVGARANKYYLTESRNYIIDILSHDTKGLVIGRDGWHYNKIVYDHQIKKEVDSNTNLVDHNASEEFQNIVKKSIFSLCPSGSGPNSIRLWESIGFGAIPVVLADTYLPPGNLELWDEAVVYCDETKEAIRSLPNRLEEMAKDPELLARKRHAMSQLWMIYGPDCFVYDIQKLFLSLDNSKQSSLNNSTLYEEKSINA